MPLVATRGAASAQGFGEFAQSAAPVYIEDVFNTFLYTGNGSTQTITNGIDLSGKGGMVWLKSRSAANGAYIQDSARGFSYVLQPSSTNAQFQPSAVTAGSSGFTINTSGGSTNANGITYASWTFREQPKFFDVVTWTGDDNVRSIPHSLGSTPGCVIIKPYSGDLGGGSTNWYVWHRSVASTQGIFLNRTDQARDWDSGLPLISVDEQNINILRNNNEISATGQVAYVNNSRPGGQQYIAYIFAHNAGGFGLTGTDNVISCGSYTGNGSSTIIDLGYEPQWIVIKPTNAAGNWVMLDNMRGLSGGSNGTPRLYANSASAEEDGNELGSLNATGFTVSGGGSNINGRTYIYIAIRRGPMRTPTSSTGLYSANRYQYNSGYAGGLTTTTVSGAAGGFGGFPTDLVINTIRNQSGDVNRQIFLDRLRGIPGLWSTQTYAESSPGAPGSDAKWDNMVGVTTSGYPYYVFTPYIFTNYFLRRAPSFFDEVCYTGTGSATTVAHNLTVVPEMMIVKRRNGVWDWMVYTATDGAEYYYWMNATNARRGPWTGWNNTTPTSSVFSLGTEDAVNASGSTYVAYLFASCPNVSKVGSYTGTGSTQTINCGFTGGARFVMIKRTDSTGNWWIWDTVDGMVTGTNPRIPMNTTTAEANDNWVYTTAGGFQIVTTDATVNASGGSYIYLAIA